MNMDLLRGPAEQLSGQTKLLTLPPSSTPRDVFESSLRDAGVPDTHLREALEAWDRASAATGSTGEYTRVSQMEISDVFAELRNWFQGRTFRVEDSVDVEFGLPLFILGAPNAPDCKASFTMKRTDTRKYDWYAVIFGTGLSKSRLVQQSVSSTFRANTGEIKVLFIPMSVPVEKVTYMVNNVPVGDGIRVDAERAKHIGEPSACMLPPGATLPMGDVAMHYRLSGDSSGAVSNHTYEYKKNLYDYLPDTAQLGLKAFDADLSIKVNVDMTWEASLDYELRSGFDYELHHVVEGHGLVWGAITPPRTSGL
ncbi:hypothetical protein [Streptomyces sp. NBC_01768]|uniref:hypothetical protein n=1 Tax=Streptomyces sp. NBC_01768 TaxID=2975938 RepID=UPI002DDBDA2D|nr:hypothetical protein [Streptomyces sp. NBC_01768]WSC34074.1 hypothetical protein OG902_46940 [Streptomyces sp. NBC_01768]